MNPDTPKQVDVRFSSIAKGVRKGMPILVRQLFWGVFCPTGTRRLGAVFGQPGSLPTVVYSLKAAIEPLFKALFFLLETVVLLSLLVTCWTWFPFWVWVQRRRAIKQQEAINAEAEGAEV